MEFIMNIQQQKILFAILKDNKEAFEMFPEQFVPFGYELLQTEEMEKIFHAEIDKMYYLYEKNKNK